jgi:ribosomal protein L24E
MSDKYWYALGHGLRFLVDEDGNMYLFTNKKEAEIVANELNKNPELIDFPPELRKQKALHLVVFPMKHEQRINDSSRKIVVGSKVIENILRGGS